MMTEAERNSRERSSRSQLSSSLKSAALFSCRGCRRSSTLRPLIAFDLGQRVDALDCLQRDWRDRLGVLATPSVLGDVREFEELPPRMRPTSAEVIGAG
jgi:hypothetical protein